MALLDVSDILDDPDFCDSFQVLRNVKTTDEHGRAHNTSSSSDAVGVITADRGRERMLEAAGVTIRGSILVHTQFRLSDGSSGTDADTVVWQGKQYTVVSVNDYSHFGAGFVAASCDVKPLSG